MTKAPGKCAFSVAAVILAAGRSARMGRAKLLLAWGQTSVLGHLITEWGALRAGQIAVVCAANDRPIQAELDRLGFAAADRIVNSTPEQGMFSSIRCAAQWRGWQKGLTHWAIVLGDQPHLQRQTLQRVLDFSSVHSAKVCQPARQGHGRHPVLLPKTVFQLIADAKATSLREFLATEPRQVALCELDDPGLDLDIDRPEDYEQAMRYAGQARRGTVL